MTVAVENDLESIKNALENMGYTVLPEKNFQSASAYVFVSKNSITNSFFGTVSDKILMINALKKTPEEIDFILKTRLYSHIF